MLIPKLQDVTPCPRPLDRHSGRRWLFALLTLFPIKLFAADYSVLPLQLRLTEEQLQLPGNESLGLLGVNLSISLSKYSYLGVAGYSGVSGQRGGFFTGGYTAGLEFPLSELLYGGVALFIGGGGGGAAPQGDGLMFREQAGIDYLPGNYRIGAGISRVRFPHGGIASTQPYFSLQLPISVIGAPGWLDAPLTSDSAPFHLYDSSASLALSWKNYRGSGLFKPGHPASRSISLIGVEWRHLFSGNLYYSLSTHGAYQGKADGYAEALAGGGYRWPLTPSTTVDLEAAVGAGGGGGVSTGGGIMGTLSLGIEQALSQQYFFSVHGGYTKASGGSFSSPTIGISFANRWITPTTSAWSEESAVTSPYLPHHYRIKMVEQHYFPASAIPRRDTTIEQNIDMTGVQLDHYVSQHLYVTGQAMGAWRGQAGGYATGMVGTGMQWPITPAIALDMQLLGGAGGGGGLNVGGGLLWGATAGTAFVLNERIEVQFAAGRIAAVGGGLNANQLTASIAYRYSLPQR